MDKNILILIFTQVISVVFIVINNKVDLKWIIKIQEQHESRISRLESNNEKK